MNELAVTSDITPEQLIVIQETICKGATPEERDLFFFDCQRNGVHPMDRLIHFTKRKSKNPDGTWGTKYTPITSIDFLRMRAESSGEYNGQDDAVFTGKPKEPGFMATVTVYRFLNGQRIPIPASARWEEYKPDGEFGLWGRMPHLMLAKCAEALALRKAFPKHLHGLYTHEEMAQADNKSGPTTPKLGGATTKQHLKALVESADASPEPDLLPPLNDSIAEAQELKRQPKPPPPKGGYAARPKAAEPEQQSIPEPTPGEVRFEDYRCRLDGADADTAETIFGEATMDTTLPEAYFKKLKAYFDATYAKKAKTAP